MSTTVDSRVVEMRFDNQHFEKNVSTTMSTLDKLKQKLNLTGASKSLEGIGTAAKKVDLSGIGNSADTVGLRFNAMYTMADQAFRNITNSAMMYGKRIVSAFTIDPVKSGFSEYETQINAVQTILANTESKGTTLDQVNQALDTLNTYADKTIYNFTEMTRNIGTFTAAGTDLETSVKAIQGIANLAAVSGSTSQQASTAMYQLSQALSSGTVKLMDWNSVVNAGMGGQVFQDALKETARVHGVAIDDMIEEQGSFRETLSEGWLTAEILTETLEKFTMTTEGATDAEIAANREKLKSIGYTEEQIDAIFKLGNTATNAATKVKTYTQLWDTLKEAAQSGWTQTWEIIIGDFEEAKELWTGVSDTVGEFIGGISNWRNTILEGALGSTWERLVTKINEAGMETDFFEEKVKAALSEAGYDVDALIEKYGSLEGIFQNVSGTTDILAKTLKNLFDIIGGDGGSLFDFSSIERVLGWYSTGDDVALVQAALEQLGHKLEKYGVDGILGPETTAAIKAFQESVNLEADGIVGPETIEALEKALLATNKLTGENKELTESYDELVAAMQLKNGRDLLIDSFKNIAKVAGDAFKAIGKAWEEIFNPDELSSEEKIRNNISGLYGLITKFHEFTVSLTKVEGAADKIRRVFRGVFSVLDIVATLLGGGFRIAFKIAGEVLSYFGMTILDAAAFVGDVVTAFHDWLFSLVDISEILDVVVPAIQIAAEWISNLCSEIAASDEFIEFKENVVEAALALYGLVSELVGPEELVKFASAVGEIALSFGQWVLAMGNLSGVQDFFQYLMNGIKVVFEWVKGIENAENVTEYLVKGIITGILSLGNAVWDVVAELGGYIVEGLIEGIETGGGSIWDTIVNVCKYALEAICEFFGIESPSKVMMVIGGFLIAGLVTGIQDGFGTVGETIKGLFNSIMEFIGNIDIGGLIAAAVIGGLALAAIKIANAFEAITSPLEGFGEFMEELGDGIKNISKGVKNYLNSKALLNMAYAIGILALSLVALTFVNVGKLWSAVGAIVVVGGVLMALMAVLNTIKADALQDKLKIIAIIGGIAAAVMLVALALSTIASIKEDGLARAQTTVGLFAAVVMILLASTRLTSEGDINSIAKFMLSVSVAFLAMTHVAKVAASLDEDQMNRAYALVGAFMLVILALVASTYLVSEKQMDEVSKFVLKAGIAMMLMAVTAKIAASIKDEDMTKAYLLVLGFSAILYGFMAMTKFVHEKDMDSLGSFILKAGIAIMLMAFVAKIAAGLKSEDIPKIVTFISIFVSAILVLVAATNRISEKKLAGVAGTLLAAGVVIMMMALTAALLGMIDPDKLKTGTIAVGAIVIMVGALMKAANGISSDCKSTLLGVAIAIAALAASVILLSLIDWKKLIAPTVAMSALLGMFSLVLRNAKNIQTSMGVLIVLTAAIGVMAAALFLLASKPWGNVLAAAGALSMVMLAMVGVLKILDTMWNMDMKSMLKAVFILSTMAAPLFLFSLILSKMGNVKNATANASALCVLASVMAVLLIPLEEIGKSVGAALKGVAALTTMAVPLGFFAQILVKMDGLQNGVTNAKILCGLATVMTVLVGLLTIVGNYGFKGINGVVTLTAMAVPLFLLVKALKQMSGIQNASENATILSVMMAALTGVLVILSVLGKWSAGASAGVNSLLVLSGIVLVLGIVLGVLGALKLELSMSNVIALSTMLVVLTGVLAALSRVGPLASAAYPAMLALAVLIVGMGVVLYALGALMEYVPRAEEFLDNGITVMGKIGEAIGTFVGGIVKGFAVTAISGLPEIGLYLSAFMVNLAPFIEGAKTVDEKVLAGAGILSAVIIALTAADLISSIASWLQGGSSFASLGTELSAFMINAAPFIEGASMITEEMVSGVKALAETILILTAADVLDGLTSWFTGGSSLASFGEELPVLASGLAAFKSSLNESGFTDEDAQAVEYAANAVKTLSAAAKEIPNSGGWAGAILGENDLDVFAEKFPKLGEGLANFKNAMIEGNFTSDDLPLVEAAANAVKTLSAAAKEIPNSGGWLGAILGENDLDAFAEKFPKLGEGLGDLKTAVKESSFTEADLPMVENAAQAIKILATAADGIPNSGGWAAKIVGDNDLETFSAQFPSVATGLAGFKQNIGSWTESDTEMVKTAAGAISALSDVAEAVEDETLWESIKTALTGGFKDFVNYIPTIGSKLTEFKKNLGEGFTLTSATTIRTAIEAIEILANIKIGEASGTNLTNFSNALPGIGTNLKSLLNALGSITDESVIQAKQVVSDTQIIVSTINGTNTSSALGKSEDLMRTGGNFLDACRSFGSINATDIQNAIRAVEDLSGLVTGLVGIDVSGVTQLATALSNLATDSIQSFTKTMGGIDAKMKVTGAVNAIITAAATSVKDNSEILTTACETLVDAASASVGTKSQYDDFHAAGAYLGKGLAAGLRSELPEVRAAAVALEVAAERAIKVRAEINSPSKVFYEYGDFMGIGLVNALYDNVGSTYDAAYEMAGSAKSGLSAAISKIRTMIDTGMDAQPTIKPVMDLSDVKSGVDAMNNLMRIGSSQTVLASVGSINTTMNHRSQNNSNEDVVSAIDRLRGDMATNRGDTITINGVTYDDGSNINEAVRTIVRYARVERRR